jgi:nitrate/nitrite-specific signal transduction histidine kinase
MRQDERRKTMLIDRAFQFKLIIKFVALIVFIMILFSFFIYLFMYSEIDSNLHTFRISHKNMKDMLFPVVITISALNILVASLIISLFMLYASHKLAGPLYRFNQALIDMSNRNFNTMTKLRDGDQFYACSISLEKMSSALSGDLQKIKDKVEKLKHDIDKKANKTSLQKSIKELESILEQYKV